MKRTATELDERAPTARRDAAPAPAAPSVAARARAGDTRRYGQDIEHRYAAARDRWTQAMQAANSGRPADLASLAIAQEAYESVAAEREHWLASGQVAIPIQPTTKRRDIEVAIGQEMAWRRVTEHQTGGGLLARIRRRIGGS
jgi:hypothetical protein